MIYYNYYTMLSSQKIREILGRYGITTSKLAFIVGVDTSTARRWLMNEDNKSFKKMPVSVWMVLFLLLNINGERRPMMEEIWSYINKEKKTRSIHFIRAKLISISFQKVLDTIGTHDLRYFESLKIAREIIEKNWLPKFQGKSHTRTEWFEIFEKHKPEIHDEIDTAIRSKVDTIVRSIPGYYYPPTHEFNMMNDKDIARKTGISLFKVDKWAREHGISCMKYGVDYFGNPREYNIWTKHDLETFEAAILLQKSLEKLKK